MIIVFIGPPFAGKDTQAVMLSKKLSLSLFSMGGLIREAREKGDKVIEDAYRNYSLKGLHLPIGIKFGLLRKKIENLNDGFILNNFPATNEDLQVFNEYLKEHNLSVYKAFYLNISKNIMQKRLDASTRKRSDDDLKIILARREIQDKDRIPVINYFRNLGILEEVDGEREIDEVNKDILSRLRKIT
ncbi:MAG: nucleoside monophosphate kinase [Candidatus Levybacteria bacterium]|nr:nucleoside monophosphate kinase [Candidatus Levybacteria bacterium]